MTSKILNQYNKRRNFKRTHEPHGEISHSTSRNSFYVQKHDASHLHFDFRLELNGRLKSWAVPKGPSVIPGVRRLAIEVEDHPLEYGDFEGTIPKGEYGGGTVMLWDRGTWDASDNPRQGLRAGKIVFRLSGERLQGSWALVRSHNQNQNGGKVKHLWFLIKTREKGMAKKTREAVDQANTSVLTGRSMKEIASKGKLWISSESKTNKKEPLVAGASAPLPKKTSVRYLKQAAATEGVRRFGTKLPPGFKPELATLVSSPPQGEEWIHEIKFDGYRILVVVVADSIKLYSRNGLDWTNKLKAVADALKNRLVSLPLKKVIFDGELVALDKNGRSDFQALQAALKDNRLDLLKYYVFDILWIC